MKRLFQGLSRIRGKRIFHPFGVGFAARLTPWGEATSGAIAFDREAEALVRLSRSFGLPESIPDPCGIALRIPDLHGPGAHQDLLMVTSGAPPGARHALLPSRGFCDLPYSTILPYRLGGETVLLGARALAPRPGPRLADLVELETGGLEFEIRVARPGGDWRPVARLALGPRLPDELTERLDFDPTHTGGGLELVGLLNRLRGPAYRGSQMGRYASYSS